MADQRIQGVAAEAVAPFSLDCEVDVELTPGMKLINGIPRLSPAPSAIMCRDLGAVAAEVHAAPSAGAAPARVVEK